MTLPNKPTFIRPEPEAAYAALRTVISQRPLALIFDVDGTLAPLAPTPSQAIVPDATQRLLRLLVRRGAICAAVSGRSALDAHRLVGVDELFYVGNHGIDQVVGGTFSVLPRAASYIPRIEAALLNLQQAVDAPGIILEPKGATASIHYRLVEDADAVRAHILAVLDAWRNELRITEGKYVVELRPPVKATKGSAVLELVRRHGCRGVLYAGDDLTDVDAFSAVAQLRGEGVAGVSLAVCDVETPPEVSNAADIQVAGVAGIQSILVWLAEALPPAASGIVRSPAEDNPTG